MELARKVMVDQPPMTGAGWEQVSPAAKECIRLMLTKDPNKRPTAENILNHKWFKVGAMQQGLQALRMALAQHSRS